jgi:hypothetical protein
VPDRASRIAVIAGVLTTLAACEAGGPPQRGFGSRQLLASSDPTLKLDGWLAGGVQFSLGAYPGPVASYRVDLQTGAVTPRTDVVKTERFECTYDTTSDTLTITDTQSGATTRLEGVVQMPCPTTADERLIAWRAAAPDEVTVWTGPYDRLEPLTLPLKIRKLFYRVDDAFIVLAAQKADPDALGLYGLSTQTLEPTELVPGRLVSATAAEGATVTGELGSASLWPSSGLRLTGKGHYAYVRVMTDGQTVQFVGPFEDGPRELAVAPFVPFESSVPGTADVAFPFGGPLSWIDRVADGRVFRAWDDSGRRLVACPWQAASGLFVGSVGARGRRLLIGGSRPGEWMTSALLLVSFDAATPEAVCKTLAAEGVKSAGFSPAGTRMFWIDVATDYEWGLWLADGEGANARRVGTAQRMGDGRFVSETRLDLNLEGDLVWLDASEAMPALHYVAENIFGFPIDLEGKKVITGYDFNAQDGNGWLGLVDRDTGRKQLVSPSVSSYLLLLSNPAGDPQTRLLAYVVRGRNPSSQDGLWIATLSAEDLR